MEGRVIIHASAISRVARIKQTGFKTTPTIVLTSVNDIDLFACTLPDISQIEKTRLLVKTPAPWISQSLSENLIEHLGI